MQEGFVITIRTADRSPSRNYLLDTLANLERAGLFKSRIPFDLIILDTGKGTGEFLAQVKLWLGMRSISAELVRAECEKTPNRNAIAALVRASKSEHPWHLFLEDDIDVCADFLESVQAWLNTNQNDNCLVYPLCAPYSDGGIKKRRDPFYYQIGGFYGTQAYVVARRDSGWIAQWMTEKLDQNPMRQGHDLLLKEWAAQEKKNFPFFLSPTPDFVQHIGKDSSLHPGRFHDYQNFAGPTWSYVNGQPSYFSLNEHKSAKCSARLCKCLAEYLPKDEPIYDLGCGVGAYVAFLQGAEFSAFGFEGTPGIQTIARTTSVTVADLCKPLPYEVAKGSVISIEVGEHIPKEFEAQFLENIDELCSHHLVLSWAVRGQKGLRHVNEMNGDELLPKLAKRGFQLQQEPTKRFREEAGKDLWWFKKSIYVLKRK